LRIDGYYLERRSKEMSDDEKEPQGGGTDFSVASSSMPDRGLDAGSMGLDEALGTAHRDASNSSAQGSGWSEVYERVDTANANDGPLTADYEDLENPGTTTLDEEFAASGDA
jgi:hypothetical protein